MTFVRLVVPVFLVILMGACAGPATDTSAYGVPDTADREALLALGQEAYDALARGPDPFWTEHLTEEGSFASVSVEDGVRRVWTTSFDEWRESQASRSPSQVLERSWDPIVLVDGDVATVFTRYELFLDGVFHHCGTDVFTCLRTDTGWTITHLVWTVEQDCEPSPLGPPPGLAPEEGAR